MKMKEISIKLLTKENFEPFGKVIELPSTKPTISNDALDYWGALADLDIEKPQVSFLVVKKRDFVIDKMERHVKPTEVFIPLEGTSVFPVAPPKNVKNPKAEVPVGEIAAFLLDGSKGVVMKKGTWHWVAFPTTEKATFAVILGAETVEKDLDIKDLKPPLKIHL
jgi:ureidoglycolate lyase